MFRSALGRSSPVSRVAVAATLDVETRAIWQNLETCGISTPYQSLAWYTEWARIVAGADERPLIVTAFDDQGRPTLLLPLMLSIRMSARIAAFAGGKHANFGMPLLANDVVFSPDAITELFEQVRRQRSDVDLVHLVGLPSTWVGVPNPLVGRNSQLHTAPASLFNLQSGNWERDASAARRRRWRASDRALSAAGVCLRRARTIEELERALEAFVAHKDDWFSNRKLANPFRQSGVTDFFLELAAEPESAAEVHCLHDADDNILATAAALVGKGRISLMLLSYDARSALAVHSPGIKIVRDIAADAAERGYSVLDLGLGEAQYKAALGAQTDPAYSTSIPFTVKGRLVGELLDAQRRIKIALKNRPRLLSMLIDLRLALLAASVQLGFTRPAS